MKTITTALALTTAAFTPSLHAQEASEPLPVAVIAVIDVDRVSSETMFGQAFTQQMTQLRTALETEMTGRRSLVEADQAEFRAAVEAFQAEREQMTDADVEAREAELTERQQALQDLFDAVQVDAEAAQRRLQNETNVLLDELNQKIRPHVSAVVAELGIDILLPISQTVLSGPELDITIRVIAKADEAFEASQGTGSDR